MDAVDGTRSGSSAYYARQARIATILGAVFAGLALALVVVGQTLQALYGPAPWLLGFGYFGMVAFPLAGLLALVFLGAALAYRAIARGKRAASR